MSDGGKAFNKNILIAVDESENSGRAVSYVAQMLGNAPGIKVALLHVIPEPEEDYFEKPEEKEQWIEAYKKSLHVVMESYRKTLIRGGFDPADVSIHSTLRYCPSMAECILLEREKVRYDTIVVGRRGRSRSEEFLFGSISSKIINHAGEAAVWVVS